MTEQTKKPANIYAKIQTVKYELLQKNLKKSWKNTYAKYEYYELADILPSIIELCWKYWLFTQVLFDNDYATLQIIDCEDQSQMVAYTSPMRTLELKGCNEIQALWWIETYERRYLYMNAFDIVENDMFDAVTVKDESKKKPEFTKESLWKLSNNKEYLTKFSTAEDLLKDVEKYYTISDEMKTQVKNAFNLLNNKSNDR